ncbi:DUF58 domain-containing protein [Calidifontibacter sp. DB0510]|uniref:DUF58 domain-containing protein n=1 Tax=Metallococcus carri TaxID=1656884 RepID=A0A967EAM3_9MICO|nr:DUF58 domain-containing protein [Metallococcus carri]NHN56044.1 DUF58 domain-containing protein [Metallococcus carri]NOP37499.1 DUF58 domain-containing protein [Calidifontibacter sp. DB2511S]
MNRRRGRFTSRGLAFVSSGVTLTLGGILLGYRDITRVGVLLLVLAGIARWLAGRPLTGLAVQRRPEPDQLPLGARTSVELTITNEGRRRTGFVLAEDSVDYALGDRPRFVLPSIEPDGGRSVSYVLDGRRRGEHQLGPLHVRVRDPFGLTERDSEVPGTGSIIVLPRTYPLGSVAPPGTGDGSEGSTPAMVALHGDEDVSIRGYRDGDDLRRVHWKASAHRDELMVRQVDRPARRSCLLLLDPRADAHAGTGEHSSFEWAVSALASIGVRMSELGFRLELVTREGTVPLAAGEQLSGHAVLLHLARAETGTEGDLRRMLHTASERLSTGGVVIAVLGGGAPLPAEVPALRQTGAAGVGLVMDAATFGGLPNDHPEQARDSLAAAGWRTAVVPHDASIPAVWQHVARRSLVRVGAL